MGLGVFDPDHRNPAIGTECMERWPEIGPFARATFCFRRSRFDDRITGKVDKYAQRPT